MRITKTFGAEAQVLDLDVARQARGDGLTAIRRVETLACFPQIIEMMREGMSLRKIATIIQEEFHVLQDVQRESVIRTLRRVRGGDSASDEPWTGVNKRSGPAESPGDVEIAIREDLIDAQATRISANLETEKQHGRLIDSTRLDIRLMWMMLDDLWSLKKELGAVSIEEERRQWWNRRHPQLKGPFADVISNPESRHKVLTAVDLIVKSAGALAKDDEEMAEFARLYSSSTAEDTNCAPTPETGSRVSAGSEKTVETSGAEEEGHHLQPPAAPLEIAEEHSQMGVSESRTSCPCSGGERKKKARGRGRTTRGRAAGTPPPMGRGDDAAPEAPLPGIEAPQVR